MKFIKHLITMAFVAILFVEGALAQNTCASPFVISSIPFSSGTQTTCGTGNDYGAGFAPCVSSSYGGGEDYVYQLSVTAAPVTYQFTLGGAATWKILSLHSACPPAAGNCLAGVASSSGSGNFQYSFTTNGTYYLIVDTWPTPTCGEFTVSISLPAPPAPCQNGTQYPSNSVAIDPNGTQVTISTCSFAGEYSVVTGAVAGQTLRFTSSAAGDQITVRSGTFNGPVLAYGPSPLVFANTFTGTVYPHWNTVSCGSNSSCRTTTVQCTNCPLVVDPCASITTIACGASTTAALSGNGVGWSPGSCGFSTPGQEKVYSFTATSTGVHNLQVTSSSNTGYIDYFIKAASGGCSSTGWGCIDDIFSPTTVSLGTLTAGTTYYILLDAETTSSVTHTFQINCPVNDPCSSITTLNCAAPVTAALSGSGAGWSPNSCGFTTPGAEKVYSFTPTATGVHNLQVTSTNSGGYIDYFIKAASGGCSSTGWSCIDDVFSPTTASLGTLTAGTTYYILLDAETTASVTHTFQINCPSSPPPCLALPTSPTNGQTGLCPSNSTNLSWPASTGATSYDLYFSMTNPPSFLANVAGTSTTVATANASGTWYWQIRPVGPGGTASGCAVWSYTRATGAFTLPANGASTVACPALIVQPVPPTVVTNCGTTVTPTGPTITNSPNPITCEGTRTFTWTYNNGFGQVSTWSHVTTVERQPFSISTPNGSATVACPNQTDAQPAPPVVLSNCGEVLTPVVSSSAKPNCEGPRFWYFVYTDCEGNTATWSFLYTVEYNDFTVPASEVEAVECPLNVSAPTPPTVYDSCNKLLNPTGPVVASTNNANGCEASRSYTWTYQDCEGTVHTWSKTFNIQYTADFFVYPNTEDYVGCLLYAQPPVPPTIYDDCGIEIQVTGPAISESIDDSGCSGVRTFTYVYTNCGGFSHTWSHTYYANDNEPPVGNCVGGSLNSVDVTNLSCIEDVPCPTDYDFSSKIEEMLAAGNIYDICSGDDLIVLLDSWSTLWQCNDDNGDGVYTFGRTFYFSIIDQCGNEMASLCPVTYSGVCQPLEFFIQSSWGIEGGEPSASTAVDSNDLQTITTLLAQGPLMVGGSLRSLTLTDAQCVQNLLPGIGYPTVLSNCQQTNCNGCNPTGPGGMKNSLAANTIALMLNMRFNVQYHGLTMTNIRNQSLGCIEIDPNIRYCPEGGPCKLRLFDSFGNAHEYPYTIGGLLDLSNLYLNGGLALTGGTSPLYAAAINQTLLNVNEYWNNGQTPTSCSQLAASPVSDGTGTVPPSSKAKASSDKMFSLAPNPASSEVTFKLAEMVDAQEVSFELYNQLGQLVLRKDFGRATYINERIDLSGISNGLYIVSVKAGNARYEQKLVVGRN